MIKLVNITKVFGKNTILNNLNLQIQEGDFVIIIGESGAGKSTVLKLITGETKPSSGDVFIDDIHVNRLRPQVVPFLRRKIGVVFQDFKLLPTRTVFENISLAMEVNGKTNREIQVEVPKLLERVGLAGKANNYPNELSGGEKQRVAIARALSHDPIILIADEPTGNLDQKNTLEIIALLLSINNSGTTVILTTHDHEIVDRLNKRVIEIKNGAVIMDRPPTQYADTENYFN